MQNRELAKAAGMLQAQHLLLLLLLLPEALQGLWCGWFIGQKEYWIGTSCCGTGGSSSRW
jgi:hypothetical protein